jgi:hypothetical protein
MGAGGESHARTETLWRSHRGEYVRIEPQDISGAQVAANDQPVHLTAGEIRGMLETLRVSPDGDAKSAIPVFAVRELDILSEKLSEGLAQARAREDIGFAVAGYRSVLFGASKEWQMTTGRVFFQGGKLNLIFREVHREYDDKIEQRLHPPRPGSRAAAIKRAWRLLLEPPVTFADVAGASREDWVVIEAEAMPHRAAEAQATPMGEPPPVGGNQELPEGVNTVDLADPKHIKERLMTLKRLRDTGVITEEEYCFKRRRILDEL